MMRPSSFYRISDPFSGRRRDFVLVKVCGKGLILFDPLNWFDWGEEASAVVGGGGGGDSGDGSSDADGGGVCCVDVGMGVWYVLV